MPVDKVHELLNFWFGALGSADLPTSERTTLWFGDNENVRQQMADLFGSEFEAATIGKLDGWCQTPRGCLALIILLDQFPRYLYRGTATAFAYDQRAQQICLEGLQQKVDHSLTLIERVFFYMPLVHAEEAQLQEKSIRLYQQLVTLSMTDTTQIYQLFLAYAYA